jgi:hypothetical protein
MFFLGIKEIRKASYEEVKSEIYSSIKEISL